MATAGPGNEVAAALEDIKAAFRDADEARREQGYASIEEVVVHKRGAFKGAVASNFAASCVPTLCREVLCADDSKVNAEEFRRAYLLLGRMVKFDPRVVGAALVNTKEADGGNVFATWSEPCSTLGRMLQKKELPDQLTDDDALTVAAFTCPWPLFWLDASNTFVDMQIDTVEGQMASFFVWPDEGTGKARGYTAEPFIAVKDGSCEKLALLTLRLLEKLLDSDFRKNVADPEMITCGALGALTNFGQGDQKVSEILFKAGAVRVAMQHLEGLDPAARILRANFLAGVALYSTKDIYTNMLETCADEAETAEAMKILNESGIIDVMITSLEEYQRLDDPRDANPPYFWYGVVSALALFDYSSPSMVPVMHKLRGIAGAIKYVIEHNLKGPEGYETFTFGNMLAAKIFGRDEACVFSWTQKSVDAVLDTAWEYMRPQSWGQIFPCTKTTPSQAVLAMSVSDEKKQMLLNSEHRYIELLLDGLLLDPDHPRRNSDQSNFVPFQNSMQQDFAEGLYQLSLFEPGLKALLRSSERLDVVGALDTLVEETEGRDDPWAEKTQEFARGALKQLCPERHKKLAVVDPDSKHIMMSYQWDVQETVKRIVAELQRRGYILWFDLERMQGSVMDAMSEAVEGAEVVLYGVSQKYKESANCRLEANYAMQEDCEMIPLMMEEGYKAKGWLGLILGTKLWYAFYQSAVDTDAKFQAQIDVVTRVLGDRGKPTINTAAMQVQVPEGIPAPAAAPPSLPSSSVAAAQLPHNATAAQRFGQPTAQQSAAPQFGTIVEWSALMDKLIERDTVARQEAKIERTQLEAKIQQLNAQLMAAPPRAITEEQLRTLHARLERLYTAKLLTEGELHQLEDTIADWVEMEASMVDQVVTEVMIYATSGHSFAAGATVHKLIKLATALSESDASFARQIRRKFFL